MYQSRGVIRELIAVCINKEWGVRFQVHVLPGDFVDHRLVHLGPAGLLPVVQGFARCSIEVWHFGNRIFCTNQSRSHPCYPKQPFFVKMV